MLKVTLMAGIAAAAYGLYRTLSAPSGPERDDDGKKEIALEALSTIWARHKNTVISLERLAGLWRKGTGRPIPIETESPTFRHQEIQDFYDQYVKERAFLATPADGIVKELLGLLDREGDCPSVVNAKGEAEGLMDKNAYDVLAGVKLYRHTLNVAEEMVKAFKGSAAMLPKVKRAIG
jgi:hypothetical protein